MKTMFTANHMVMVEGNEFKKVSELTDEDRVLSFVLKFDGVEASYVSVGVLQENSFEIEEEEK